MDIVRSPHFIVTEWFSRADISQDYRSARRCGLSLSIFTDIFLSISLFNTDINIDVDNMVLLAARTRILLRSHRRFH